RVLAAFRDRKNQLRATCGRSMGSMYHKSPWHRRGDICRRVRQSLHVVITLCAGIACRADGDWLKKYDWTPLDNARIVAAPSNSSRVYACAGNTPWLLYSDDAGVTWQRTVAPAPPAA